MKTQLITLAASLCLLAGCTTTPTGERVLDAPRIARISGTAAYLGARFYLRDHPQERDKFAIAIAALKVVEAMEAPDAAALADALAALPVRELQGDEGALYVSAAVFLWDELRASKLPLSQPEVVRLAAPQIRAGLERALAATQ